MDVGFLKTMVLFSGVLQNDTILLRAEGGTVI